MEINREDMLELTRRMTVSRNCFGRMAGAYMDEDGYVDGTFNTHFQKLSAADKTKNLKIAKAVLFSETNKELKYYSIGNNSIGNNSKEIIPLGSGRKKPGGVWQLMMALRECGLKNDALLLSLYEYIGQRSQSEAPYYIYIFHGNYDVPLKGSDKAAQWESEEVYNFLICTVGPVGGDYQAGEPEWGFLFPAFTGRSTDLEGINLFSADGNHDALFKLLGI